MQMLNCSHRLVLRKDRAFEAAVRAASVDLPPAPPVEVPELFTLVNRGDVARAQAKVGEEPALIFELTIPASDTKLGGRTLLHVLAWCKPPVDIEESLFDDLAASIVQRSRTVIDKRDGRGMTALMLAASAARYPMVKLLVKYGASVLLSSG